MYKNNVKNTLIFLPEQSSLLRYLILTLLIKKGIIIIEVVESGRKW